jgi:23S rRNA (cytidine2498-2'-O)-methyltransferase
MLARGRTGYWANPRGQLRALPPPRREIGYTGLVHLVLAAPDSRDASKRELRELPGTHDEIRPGLFACDFPLGAETRLPFLVFARQFLAEAREVRAASIREWAGLLVDNVAGVLPDEQTWSLHVLPFKQVTERTRMGARAWHSRTRGGQPLPESNEVSTPNVGEKRCHLVRQAAVEQLEKRRRHLARHLREYQGVFVADEALVQLILLSPERGFLSVAPAPLPFREQHVVSCFPAGEVPLAVDKQAPSRAFTKLIEAELRLGRRIAARDTCVDLGASPGSWTYVALRRGATVTAVDRADLREDLMQHRNVNFQRGDAFRFVPPSAVDWLLCDVIASADRSAENLLEWLRRKWCRHFVVTLKVDDEGSSDVLTRLKRELPALTSELRLQRLSANKKEVCAFGTIAD